MTLSGEIQMTRVLALAPDRAQVQRDGPDLAALSELRENRRQ
jgi:hypothetical protein